MSLKLSIIDTSFSDDYELPVHFSCKKCGSDGELILTTVDLVLNNPVTQEGDDDLIQTGSVQFDLKGFEVSIGLEASPSVSLEEGKVINIFRFPRFGFNAGFISAGIDFGMGIDFIAKATGDFDLGFGFDVVVPDSTLRIDLAELQNSFINGINDTTITAHTLSANTSDVEVSHRRSPSRRDIRHNLGRLDRH
ncbi:hypothetical protein K505DRAFT_363106 [Melanomma pulvis-pyrius CBS 109.77]|uniref:Uncharacterized protein n=1 Tax=Melanomma pulvis-pyrius CBS 109.77 TaxID=1314802 RepID=A0A6A6X6S3_9PLEO|nr:hypothetical protein K505DRAFT_363106 [Melanomma pulvis-pyrius CBS 109.77]